MHNEFRWGFLTPTRRGLAAPRFTTGRERAENLAASF
jgi:hypothetical protein